VAAVLSLAAAREERTPHLHGAAQCIGCQHKWEAVAPVGTVELECPACHLPKGAFVNQVMRGTGRFVCNCGCDLFRISQTVGPYCANCAEPAVGGFE
jgi:hypothetical protein